MNHLLHSFVLALLLYLVYFLFMKSNVQHAHNRFYLLLLPVVSVFMPFLVVPLGINMTGSSPEIVMQVASPETSTIAPVIIDSSQIESSWYNNLSCTEWVFGFYILGVLISIILFSIKLYQVLAIIHTSRLVMVDDTYVYKTGEADMAFSFLGRMVISSQYSSEEVSQIIAHEQIHVKQKHSWDLLFYEILKISVWFHPVAHFAQKDLQQVHEFIVDEKLASSPRNYIQQLITNHLGFESLALVNNHSKKSILKNRIAMLKSTAPKKSITRYLLILLPLLLTSIIYTSCTEDLDITEKVYEDYTGETVTVAGYVLPTVQDFKYGQKDFYKGMTEDEIAISKSDSSFRLYGIQEECRVMKMLFQMRYIENSLIICPLITK